MIKKVLIIGGNGFIGRSVVEKFVLEGVEVSVIDKNEIDIKNFSVKYYTGDIFAIEEYQKLIEEQDAIVYLVSSILPNSSLSESKTGFIKEIPYILNLCEICKDANVKRIIFASSGGTVYGKNGVDINLETSPTFPINNYAILKLAIENILIMYNRVFDMENIILRISNPYGKGQKLSSGVGAVTTFAVNIVNEKPITIFGDGENIRDYVYIKDVANAFLLSLNWNMNKDIIPIFNIGSGEGKSLNQLIELISRVLKVKTVIKYDHNRKQDIRKSILNIDFAKKELGYIPMESTDDGIANYVLEIKNKKMQSGILTDGI